ncbi:hypothetical protein H4R18_001715 [Coemansia javaensis]|uniref:Uncharacterized protein n=1 Tax=Coemansia javaensis TaxID=2761396 RepID=A0A9W8HKL7_9FUNG|nr:hypothetical protein H4R18_001715 [Coemansia javaensis]
MSDTDIYFHAYSADTEIFEGMLKVHHSEYGIDILDAAFYELISKVSGRMPGDNTMIVDKGTDDDGDTTVVGEDTDRD